jgi:hypothetical protein
MIFVASCATSISGNFCTVATPLTPKAEAFTYLEEHDPVFVEQIYKHWGLMEAC